jgi:hypothetical protein
MPFELLLSGKIRMCRKTIRVRHRQQPGDSTGRNLRVEGR